MTRSRRLILTDKKQEELSQRAAASEHSGVQASGGLHLVPGRYYVAKNGLVALMIKFADASSRTAQIWGAWVVPDDTPYETRLHEQHHWRLDGTMRGWPERDLVREATPTEISRAVSGPWDPRESRPVSSENPLRPDTWYVAEDGYFGHVVRSPGAEGHMVGILWSGSVPFNCRWLSDGRTTRPGPFMQRALIRTATMEEIQAFQHDPNYRAIP